MKKKPWIKNVKSKDSNLLKKFKILSEQILSFSRQSQEKKLLSLNHLVTWNSLVDIGEKGKNWFWVGFPMFKYSHLGNQMCVSNRMTCTF